MWLSCSLLAAGDYFQEFEKLTNNQKIIFVFIFVIGGPFFVISNGLSIVLEEILGINDNDDYITKGGR